MHEYLCSDRAVNCTRSATIDFDDSVNITCSIEYDFWRFGDWETYQPSVNLTFYLRENDSQWTSIDPRYLMATKDTRTNRTRWNWKHSISHVTLPLTNKERSREYLCIAIPDTPFNDDVSQNEDRVCRTTLLVRRKLSFHTIQLDACSTPLP